MNEEIEYLEKKIKYLERENKFLKLNNPQHLTSLQNEFFKKMGREIRTPLSGIAGMADLLLESELSTDQLEQIKVIKNCGTNILKLINDIIDFTALSTNKLKVSPINFEVSSIVANIRTIMSQRIEKQHLNLVTNTATNIPSMVYGDAYRIQQCLINLIGNAIKFTEEGSVTLNIDLKSIEDDSVSLKFEVVDTGIGILEEKLGNIFEYYKYKNKSEFYTTDGSGMGLAITSKLIELMGSNLAVESNFGEGSKFFFTLKLPIIKEDDVEVDMDSKKMIRDVYNKHHILLVEDNKVNQKVTQKMFEKMGYEIDVASNGLEALDYFENGHYDLILLDCQIPIINGFDVTREIRRREGDYGEQQVKIIAMTAESDIDVKEKCLNVGMNDFIQKPVSFKSLRKAVVSTMDL